MGWASSGQSSVGCKGWGGCSRTWAQQEQHWPSHPVPWLRSVAAGKAARECNCEPSSVPRHPATPLTHPTHPSHPPLPSARALAPQPDPSRAAPGAESGQLSMNTSSLLPRASSPEPLGSMPAPGARLASTHGWAGRKVLPSLLCSMLGPGGGLFPPTPQLDTTMGQPPEPSAWAPPVLFDSLLLHHQQTASRP